MKILERKITKKEGKNENSIRRMIERLKQTIEKKREHQANLKIK